MNELSPSINRIRSGLASTPRLANDQGIYEFWLNRKKKIPSIVNLMSAFFMLLLVLSPRSFCEEISNQQKKLNVFSIIERSSTKDGEKIWIEKFYLVNDSGEPVSVTSTSVSAAGPDEKGKAGIKTTSKAKVGSDSHPSVVLQPKMLWQFSSLTWARDPNSFPCKGEISVILKKQGNIELISFDSIARYINKDSDILEK